MTGATLDLSPLLRAIERLDEGVARADAAPQDDLVRDGAIQRFEYAHELRHKMLRRHLESVDDTPGDTRASGFPDLVGLGPHAVCYATAGTSGFGIARRAA